MHVWQVVRCTHYETRDCIRTTVYVQVDTTHGVAWHKVQTLDSQLSLFNQTLPISLRIRFIESPTIRLTAVMHVTHDPRCMTHLSQCWAV